MNAEIKTGIVGVCVAMFSLMILSTNIIFSIIDDNLTTSLLITDLLLFVAIVAIFLTNVAVIVNTSVAIEKARNAVQEIKIGSKEVEKEIETKVDTKIEE